MIRGFMLGVLVATVLYVWLYRLAMKEIEEAEKIIRNSNLPEECKGCSILFERKRAECGEMPEWKKGYFG